MSSPSAESGSADRVAVPVSPDAEGTPPPADRTVEIAALRAELAERDAEIARLRQIEGRLRSLLDSLQNTVFYRGEPNGEVHLFGTAPLDVSRTLIRDGRVDRDTWHALIHPEDRPAYLEAERRRREEGRSFTIDFRFQRPDDGSEAWAREIGYAVPTGDGHQFNDGYIIDITEIKRAEHDRREATETALVASRTKTEFLANMSHELRTPLNAVIGFAEILLTEAFGPLGGDRYRDYARDIHASALHLKQLIDDILDVAKVESGKAELHEARVDLTTAIASALRMVRERAVAKGVALATEVPAGLPSVMADEGKLRQILLNLLSNAIKFTPTGGRVTVHAAEDADGALTLTVADTGIGIRAEDIPKALEPFVQLHGGLSRSFEGTGLGLPLSAKLTELHGGVLTVASRPGAGTAVTVALPPERTVRPIVGGPAPDDR